MLLNAMWQAAVLAGVFNEKLVRRAAIHMCVHVLHVCMSILCSYCRIVICIMLLLCHYGELICFTAE